MRRFIESFPASHCMHNRAASALSVAVFVDDESDLAAWKASPDYKPGPAPSDRVRFYIPRPVDLRKSFSKWVEDHQDLVDPDTGLLLFTNETHKLVKTGLEDIDAWRLSGEMRSLP